MAPFFRDDDELQMNAYCDAELDPASAAEIERRLEVDDLLKARYSQMLSLRRALRELPRVEMPQGLPSRIAVAVGSEILPQAKALHQRHWSLRALAAAALLGAFVASSVMMTLDRVRSHREIAREVVGSHIRSLLAGQPFDIASSDQHTIKPWFTARLPESPRVVDLAPQGFALVGGRVDVVDQTPAATIVYKHAAHLLSLTALRPGQSVASEAIAGYNVRSWNKSNFTYVVVSDLTAEDLAAFELAFSKAR
jgi:anti-sigma factor RsiW